MVDNSTIFAFFIGTLISVLGGIIKSEQCVEMLNGFNEEKYDKKLASKIIGNNLLFLGVAMILVRISNLVLGANHLAISTFLQRAIMIIVAIVTLGTIYKLYKKGKINSL